MDKIVFFNHYHRGDLHIQKEFIKQLMQELPQLKYEYKHSNPSRLTEEFGTVYTGAPYNMDPKEPFYADEDALYINTWIGCYWDIFAKTVALICTVYMILGQLYSIRLIPVLNQI